MRKLGRYANQGRHPSLLHAPPPHDRVALLPVVGPRTGRPQHEMGRFQHAIVTAKILQQLRKIVWLESARRSPFPKTIFVTAAIQAEKFLHSQSVHNFSSCPISDTHSARILVKFLLNPPIQFNFN